MDFIKNLNTDMMVLGVALISTIVMIAVGVYFWQRKKKKSIETSFKGLLLGPISIWFFIGSVFYFPLVVLTLIAWGFRAYNANQVIFAELVFVLGFPLIVAISVLILIHKSVSTNVSTAKIAALTLIGSRIGVYLEEGDYYIDFGSFLIGIATKKAMPFTDAAGLLEADIVTFQLWDSVTTPDVSPILKIGLNDMYGAPVNLTCSLRGRIVSPRKTLSPGDSALLFGEAGRKALRLASTKIVDMDISGVPGVLGNLMLKHTLVVARINDTYKQHREGSLLFDRNNTRYFEVVLPGNDPEAAAKKLREKIEENNSRFHPDVLKLAKEGNEWNIDIVTIDTMLPEAAEDIGFEVDEVILSDVELSEIKQQATAKASAEPDEAISELRTAQSAIKAAKYYKKAEAKHGRDATLLGAASTGVKGVQNINFHGLNKLLDAAIKAFGNKGKD